MSIYPKSICFIFLKPFLCIFLPVSKSLFGHLAYRKGLKYSLASQCSRLQCLSAQKYQYSPCTASGGDKMVRAVAQSLQAENPVISNVLRKQHSIPSAPCARPGGCLHRGETPLSLVTASRMAKPSSPKALSKNNRVDADTEHGKF